MSKTPADLTPVEAMALAQSIRIAECNDVSALPEQTTVPVDFTVHIKGEVTRGVGTPRAATNRARTSASMVMLLVASGITRNHSPRQIIEKWSNIGSLDKVAFNQLYNGLSDEDKEVYDECIQLFESEIVGKLPLIPVKGGVKFKGNITKE
jgi:hypothetical protein